MGCNNHTYKYFEFESKDIQIPDGKISARLPGDFVLMKDGYKKETHKGNPYELIIYFETNSPSVKAERVEAISLTSSEGKVVATSEGGTIETVLTSSKSYLSYFSIKDIKVKHTSHVLRYKLYIRNKNGGTFEHVEIIFIPKFNEERSNDFIDRLMSV